MDEKKIKSVHFIGVGGVGMSGIARVACDQGIRVSGSDLRASRYTDQLKEAGVTVFIGQSADNIPDDVDIVVVSTAILENNPELQEAKRRGIEIWHRAKMLSVLGLGLDTLAVTGTHGKTTTSSMLAYTVDELGLDPTFLIGGIVRKYGTNARSGKGKYYVVEADESDKSFTYLDPAAVIVTNIEADHLDHYSDLEEIYAKFDEFMRSVHDGGVIVVCGDDEALTDLARKTGKHVVTYGESPSCDYRVEGFAPEGVGSTFEIVLPNDKRLSARLKQNPGKHNALNVAAVIALCSELGQDAERVVQALNEFEGVRRRFDLVGKASDVTVIDDYAHHPTEIAATIGAAKQLDFNQVHVLFQPHRYSRVSLCCDVLRDEFGSAFNDADTVTFMDVYPAGETPVPGVNGKTFLNVVLDNPGHPRAAYAPRRLDVPRYVAQLAQPGDLVITMGAGDVTAIGPQIVDELKMPSDEMPVASVQEF